MVDLENEIHVFSYRRTRLIWSLNICAYVDMMLRMFLLLVASVTDSLIYYLKKREPFFKANYLFVRVQHHFISLIKILLTTLKIFQRIDPSILINTFQILIFYFIEFVSRFSDIGWLYEDLK